MTVKKRVGIIGGGPAGLMAAVVAAKNGASVTVFERNEKIGKKILSTGNGKCNFTNSNMNNSFYEGSVKAVFDDIYERYDHEWLKNFFELNGVLIKQKNGYFYPNSEQASTVVDLFRTLIQLYHIEIVTDEVITPGQIVVDKNVFRVLLRNKRNYEYDSLILACGGVAAPKTGSDGIGFDIAKEFGHRIVPCVPALVQLKCSDSYCKALAGVRSDALCSLYIDELEVYHEPGELQCTDYGISGIPVFQLSRYVGYALKAKKKVKVVIDFLKDYEKKELLSIYVKKLDHIKEITKPADLADITYEMFFGGFINKKITMVVLKECGFKPTDSIETLSNTKIKEFIIKAKHLEFHVTGTNGFDQAQVSAGGISMEEIKPDLSSVYQRNLYFAGEILDIDGKCGGYNLQWAFSSGAAAGENASKSSSK